MSEQTITDNSKQNLELLKTRVSHMMDINSYRGYTLEQYAKLAQVHQRGLKTIAQEFKMDLSKLTPFEFFTQLSEKSSIESMETLFINNSYFTASLIVNNNKWI
jgi:hypothetical protein